MARLGADYNAEHFDVSDAAAAYFLAILLGDEGQGGAEKETLPVSLLWTCASLHVGIICSSNDFIQSHYLEYVKYAK